MLKFPNIKTKRLLLIDLALVVFALLYYLIFVNRGLVLSDEGYYVHYAERIVRGQIPYKDFIIQYSPGYFYLLAILYKIFGQQILVGRFLSLTFCLLTLTSTLYLLRLYKIISEKIHLLAGLTLISLGYPLLHLPLVIWSGVFFTVIIQILFLYWCRKYNPRLLFFLGISLAVSLFFRQHLGFLFLILFNGIVFFSDKHRLRKRLQSIIVLDFAWALVTFLWVYFVFVKPENLAGISIFWEFNRHYVSTFSFSYPPLTFLSQPTGFFKLLPYYFPIIYGLIVLQKTLKEKIVWEKLSFALLVLTGFSATVYPASDLLHVYPFLGLVIVSSIIFFYQKPSKILVPLVVIFILLGFYLTLFTKSYRYEDFFLRETIPLNLPKTQGILINGFDKSKSNLVAVSQFINRHSQKDDYIFVYPFAPIFYFLLDRQNPSQIVQFNELLQAPQSIYPEERVISEIRHYRVKYIITDASYRKYDSKLAHFIANQNEVARIDPYLIFELKE